VRGLKSKYRCQLVRLFSVVPSYIFSTEAARASVFFVFYDMI